ncbi:MAG: hypothetical protein WDA03_10910 [Trueperaceae bacterium]
MTTELEEQLTSLLGAVRGGRVAFGSFLTPGDADALLARLRDAGVTATAWGGYPGAKRRVVAAFPDEVPEARPSLTGWYVEGSVRADDLRGAALRAGVPADRLGDEVVHQDGVTIVTFAPLPAALLSVQQVAGQAVSATEVPLERLGGGTVRTVSAVVPSLRVDVLGARAFSVSRAYFSKGVAAGRVTVNGARAGKAATAGAGDEVYADGLGRFQVEAVEGETRRGNLKVRLAVEKS